jgi:hypothetical protein
MWTWIIIGGSILAVIILLALSGRTDKSHKWPTGGGVGGA